MKADASIAFTKFSVVIPLYNKEKTIKRTLESVLTQKFENWECIVVDDGSTDSSVEIVKQFLGQGVKLFSQRNSGPSAARNIGVRYATGNWIALLDADDYWLPHHLSDLHELINKYRQCKTVATSYITSNGKDTVCPNRWIFKGMKDGEFDYIKYQIDNDMTLIHSSAVAVNKERWIESGGFNEELRLGEDTDFWFRISLNETIAVTARPSAVYVLDLSGNSTRDVLYAGDLPYCKLENKIDQHRKNSFRKFVARFRMKSLALGTLLSGKSEELRDMCRASFFTPSFTRAIIFYFLSFWPTSIINLIYHKQRSIRGLRPLRLISVRADNPN